MCGEKGARLAAIKNGERAEGAWRTAMRGRVEMKSPCSLGEDNSMAASPVKGLLKDMRPSDGTSLFTAGMADLERTEPFGSESRRATLPA